MLAKRKEANEAQLQRWHLQLLGIEAEGAHVALRYDGRGNYALHERDGTVLVVYWNLKRTRMRRDANNLRRLPHLELQHVALAELGLQVLVRAQATQLTLHHQTSQPMPSQTLAAPPPPPVSLCQSWNKAPQPPPSRAS